MALTMSSYGEIGSNQNFSNTQILIISSKFIKFYIEWSKIFQFWDFFFTMFEATKFETHFFKFLLISTNLGKLPLADIFEDQQMFS